MKLLRFCIICEGKALPEARSKVKAAQVLHRPNFRLELWASGFATGAHIINASF